MNSIRQQLFTIARKDIVDATRDKFFIVLIVFLSLAAFISLASGSVALATDINTYNAAKETLLALGKSLDAIAAPEFYPLKLLRGAVEQIEIVGAILGVLIGFRSAISERNHQTLSIVLVRPVSNATLMGGKVIAGITLIAASLLFVFTLLFITLAYFATTAIGMDDLFRIGIVWALCRLHEYLFCSIHVLHVYVPFPLDSTPDKFCFVVVTRAGCTSGRRYA